MALDVTCLSRELTPAVTARSLETTSGYKSYTHTLGSHAQADGGCLEIVYSIRHEEVGDHFKPCYNSILRGPLAGIVSYNSD